MIRKCLFQSLKFLIAFLLIASWTTPPMQDACDGSFPSVLRESPLVTFQFEPEPFQSSFNFISWRNFREDRAQVTLTICDFTWIAGLSFETLNVKHYNVSVDGQVHSGETEQSGVWFNSLRSKIFAFISNK